MPISREDVIRGYQFILGRPPESDEKIQHHCNLPSTDDLRARLLPSRELGYKHALSREQILPPTTTVERSVVVFLHIPKCAGTTLHAMLEAQIDGATCKERHNGLTNWPLYHLLECAFFSGHYDIKSLEFIPATTRRVVTMLREPVDRLVSVYRFLRAHTPAAVIPQRHNMGLTTLARQLDAAEFFRHPSLARHPSINNCMTRTLTGPLPQKRWEAFFPNRDHTRTVVDDDPAAALAQAMGALEAMTAVGIVEEMPRSVERIFSALDLRVPDEIDERNVIDVVSEERSILDYVPPVDIDDDLLEAVAPHIGIDRQLYDSTRATFYPDGQ